MRRAPRAIARTAGAAATISIASPCGVAVHAVVASR
jgi:hypothetical protein